VIGFSIGLDGDRPNGLLWALRNTPIALDRAEGLNETIFTCPGDHNIAGRVGAADRFPEGWRDWMRDYMAKSEKHGKWMIWMTGYTIGHLTRDVKQTVGPELPGEQGTDFHESKPWHLCSLNVERPAEIVFVKAEGDPDNGPYIVDIDTFELFGYLYLVPGQ
jgi:hypothetical protein